ncbi:formin-like protein 20 isoform X4 [Lutra lutra]|uniref:formin-like protein 20 isoform X4 n=1 Tax=Lutra lutra TaxID=9657 RepID=UPI001FCFB685|nr:formin-like protein 20 isoform X4 [Lutra lutra]
MRMRGRGPHRGRNRRPRNLRRPVAMLSLCLCRSWHRSPATRLFSAASGQRSGPRNYYELLGVHPGASTEEVKRAFFSKSKELHPDRDPGNPALHSRFVELSEAYQVLSREQSRRSYDHQLSSASPPKPPATAAHARSAHQAHKYQAHSGSWEPPNAQYWAQFPGVRPQGPESRKQQHKQNQRVLGYCLLIMLAGMGLHYVAFSWSRYTGASWMKRTGSSQPSTMTHGRGPGPTEPGSRRNCRGSSCSPHLEAQGSRLPTQAPGSERLIWTRAAGCSLLATPRDLPPLETRAIKCFSELESCSLLQAQRPPPGASRGEPHPALRVLAAATREPGLLGGASPFPCCGRRGVWRGRVPAAASPPLPRPAPAPRPGGERVSGSHEPPARQPGPGPPPPPPPPPSPPPPPAATGRPPARLLRPPPRRCAALPALRAREGAAEERSPAPGPRPARPGPRHGALAAAAPSATGLGRCGRPRRAAPAGTMSPLLRRLLLAALLQLAPAQGPVSQPDALSHQKKVVSWIDVYTRATCQPREVVVPLTVELMGTVAKQLVPSCVTVQRCGGCCPDDGLECVPIGQHQVRMQILMIRYPSSQLGEMSLEEHSQCECRPKKRESALKPDRASTPHHRPQPRSIPGWDSAPGAPSPADITHPTPAPGPTAHAAPSAASALTPGPAAVAADAAASSVAKGGA